MTFVFFLFFSLLASIHTTQVPDKGEKVVGGKIKELSQEDPIFTEFIKFFEIMKVKSQVQGKSLNEEITRHLSDVKVFNALWIVPDTAVDHLISVLLKVFSKTLKENRFFVPKKDVGTELIKAHELVVKELGYKITVDEHGTIKSLEPIGILELFNSIKDFAKALAHRYSF